MKALKLRRHGEYANPYHLPLEGETGGATGASTAAGVPEGNAPGVISRFDKRSRAHSNPVAMGWIKAKYRDAVEYTRTGAGSRGLSFFAMLFVLLGGGFLGAYGLTIFVHGPGWFFILVSLACVGIIFVTVVLFPLWCIRLEMFRPEDEPVIFDRKHRKVYRITREVAPGIVGLFKPWPMIALSYDWDLIDVEHHADLMVSTNMAKRQHALVFLVRRSADDPTIIDSFDIGNRMALGEANVPCVWEHIRRFMEENGPHLPWGDKLAPVREPKSLWDGIKQIAPLQGRSFGQWFRDEPIYASFITICFPFFGTMFLFWGIGNYLAYKTSIPIRWPDEVSEAIGPALAGRRHE